MTAKNWSWKHNLHVLSVAYSFFLIRAFGLWPYTIDRRSNTFKTTWFLMAQPILTVTLILISFARAAPMLLPLLQRQWKSDASNMLIHIFGTINIGSLLTTYISVYLQARNVKSIIVRIQEFLVKSQRLLTDDTIRTVSALLIYLFKSFVLLVCLTSLACIKIQLASLSSSGFILIFAVVPILINAIVPNLFFGFILFAKVYFERINAQIVEIVRKGNLLPLQKHNHFGRLHCELSDFLDELAILHMELTRLTQDICKICNVNLTGYITWLSVNVLFQKFYVYMCISNGITELIVFPTTLVVIGVLTIIILWSDIIMIAHFCFTIMSEVMSFYCFYFDEDNKKYVNL